MSASSKVRFLVVDYQMGNLSSVVNAFRFLGTEVRISGEPADIDWADALILPGVGAFGAAMENLKSQALIEPMRKAVLDQRKPLLGICLGMQLVADSSDEDGFFKGLGWIPGHVRRLPAGDGLRIPHVGWNNLMISRADPLFVGVPENSCFYFVHSYHFECDHRNVSAFCDYGGPFAAAIQRENIFAVQFHPEKSQHSGLRLLRNFINYASSLSANGESAA